VRQRRDPRAGERAAPWDGCHFRRFFSHITAALAAELDPSLVGEDGGECLATPLGMARTVLERVVVDETIEGMCQRTGHWGGATRAGAIRETLDPMVGKAMDPCAQRRIGQMEGVRDRVEAVPFDDFAYGLGTPEHTGRLGLLQAWVSSGKRSIGKVKCEGPHGGGLQEKLRQKFIGDIDPLIGTQPFRLKFLWSC